VIDTRSKPPRHNENGSKAQRPQRGDAQEADELNGGCSGRATEKKKNSPGAEGKPKVGGKDDQVNPQP